MNIIAGILSFLITAAVNVGATFFAYGFMLIAMNGFPNSESVQPGIILFTVWAIVSTLLVSVLSVITALLLVKKKELNPFLAGLGSVIVFSIVGIMSLVVGTFASLLLVGILWELR